MVASVLKEGAALSDPWHQKVDEPKLLDEVSGRLAEKLALAVELVSFPETIRGYGHVKEQSIKETYQTLETLKEKWAAPA